MRKALPLAHAALLGAIALCSAHVVSAQQLPQYSQYLQNPYVLNPAFSGWESTLDITGGFRRQWTGMEGTPETFYLTAHTSLSEPVAQRHPRYGIPISRPQLLADSSNASRKLRHGVGLMFSHDTYGVFQRTALSGSYAAHIPVGEGNNWLSGGVSLGWSGVRFDAGEIILENPLDATYNDFVAAGNRSNVLDFALGGLFYGPNHFVGVSVHQMLNNQLRLGNETSPAELTDARLQRHVFASAGYRFALSSRTGLTPSTLLKYTAGAPVGVDVNLRFDVDRAHWLAVSYRNQDALCILGGVTINEMLRVGYSYDLTTSELNNYTGGSHEIIIGLMLERPW